MIENHPHDLLRAHVTGRVLSGDAEAVTEQPVEDRYRLTVAVPDGPAVIYTGNVDDAISRAQRELIQRTRGDYTATEYLALSTLARATGEPLYVAGMAWTLTVQASPRSASCPRCGQTMIADDSSVCGPCRQLERAPQGEQTALFNLPAAAPVQQEGALF